MAGLMGIGLTGLKAHQSALSTTSNNVANTNTPGYTRQETRFEATPSHFEGYGFIGAGVNIADISRISDQFLIDQFRADSTVFNYQDTFVDHISILDGLLADVTTGLSPQMTNFFKALQGGADDPTSIPERQLILSQSKGLVSRFNALYDRLQNQGQTIAEEMTSHVDRINRLSESIAELNGEITEALGDTNNSIASQPNDLLDQRDEKLRELAELVQVTVIPRGDTRVDVMVGNGQALVVGTLASKLTVEQSREDPSLKEVSIIDHNGKTRAITHTLSGGKLGGLIEYRDGILGKTTNALGRIAIVMADSINDQHRLGMDLEGHLGGYFFSDVNSPLASSSRFVSNDNNALPLDRAGRVEIVDASLLTADDYVLKFNGPTDNDYVLSRRSTDEIVRAGRFQRPLPADIEVEGIRITLESGSFQQGDEYLIQPVRFGARDFKMALDRVEAIALASPISTDTSLGNVGNAVISAGEMLNVDNPMTNRPLLAFSVPDALTPPMVVRFITDSVYEVLDASDPANLVALSPPLTNRHYIPGLKNEIFTDDPGQMYISATGADIAKIPAPGGGPYTNGYGAQTLTVNAREPATGVVTTASVSLVANQSAGAMAATLNQVNGVSASAFTLVELDNFTGATVGLTINGEVVTVAAPDNGDPQHIAEAINGNANLQNLNIVALSDGNRVTLRNTTGDDIIVEVTGGATDSVDVRTKNAGPVTVSAGNGTAIGGFLDVHLTNGVSLIANNTNVFAETPVIESSYRGFRVNIVGEPAAGDTFTIGYNAKGISDNRNALAMVSLETRGILGGGVNTYSDGYATMVEEIGTITNQRKIDKESSKALLLQSENAWHEISGVNLDEEAGRLIQYQAAYNASAQVVSIARDIFNTLIQSV
ncbi:MAG: flagellar hook-associated protein FlgK [Proteobacteria bacterium]|nr:MAG: flagellar hook-associated protein FlgK [Pseudomonadota bacterium]